MNKWGAFWRLARLDKPVGILLLWYPTAWALWIANNGTPSLRLIVLFFMGTLLMRSAGCVINDIADRGIDKHVQRTKLRALASGEIHLIEAFIFLMSLLFCALMILLALPKNCFYLALIAVLITFFYPFCKRFLKAPQMILGLAFSMGIPMAYFGSSVPINKDLFILFLINFMWIIAYDTMYAMTDKEDDLRIGVKSTAIYFASFDRLIIGVLLLYMHFLWLYWAFIAVVNLKFYLLWLIASAILIYQQKLISQRVPSDCFKAFLMSGYYGVVMWIAVGLGI